MLTSNENASAGVLIRGAFRSKEYDEIRVRAIFGNISETFDVP
jgi:hypothetical protein